MSLNEVETSCLPLNWRKWEIVTFKKSPHCSFIAKYIYSKVLFKGRLLHFLESDNSNYENNVTASDFDRIEQTSTSFSK